MATLPAQATIERLRDRAPAIVRGGDVIPLHAGKLVVVEHFNSNEAARAASLIETLRACNVSLLDVVVSSRITLANNQPTAQAASHLTMQAIGEALTDLDDSAVTTILPRKLKLDGHLPIGDPAYRTVVDFKNWGERYDFDTIADSAQEFNDRASYLQPVLAGYRPDHFASGINELRRSNPSPDLIVVTNPFELENFRATAHHLPNATVEQMPGVLTFSAEIPAIQAV